VVEVCEFFTRQGSAKAVFYVAVFEDLKEEPFDIS